MWYFKHYSFCDVYFFVGDVVYVYRCFVFCKVFSYLFAFAVWKFIWDIVLYSCAMAISCSFSCGFFDFLVYYIVFLFLSGVSIPPILFWNYAFFVVHFRVFPIRGVFVVSCVRLPFFYPCTSGGLLCLDVYRLVCWSMVRRMLPHWGDYIF